MRIRTSVALLTVCLFTVGVTACGDDDNDSAGGGSSTEASEGDVAGKTVCLNIYADAEPVAQAETGIRSKLEPLGVEFTTKNANGDAATQQTIAQQFATDDSCDVITPFGGAPSQSYLKLDPVSPVVFTNAGSPIELGIVKSYEEPGGNFTGAATPIPIPEEIDTLREIMPDLAKVGLIYAGGDPQGEANAKIARDYLEEIGLESADGPITGSGDTAPVTQSLANQDVDAVMIPCDNPTLTGQAGIMKVANEEKIPVFGCTGTSVENGALLSGGYNYEQVGELTADVIVEVLNGADPATTPVVVPDIEGFFINLGTAKRLGLTVPEEIVANSPGTFE